jgi:thiamine phosphate synthase YjbQ (UPF0047 family)
VLPVWRELRLGTWQSVVLVDPNRTTTRDGRLSFVGA